VINPDDLKYMAQNIARMSNQHVETFEHVNQMLSSGAAAASVGREADKMPIPPQRPVIDAIRKLSHF
jgi:hypothetical protein